MDILVLHQKVGRGAGLDEHDVLVQARTVAAALRQAGHRPFTRACTLDLGRLDLALRARRPHAVFNLVETLDGSARLAALVPALLSARGIPATGCSPDALLRVASKTAVKRRLLEAGLPTPAWIEASSAGGSPRRHGADADPAAGPWLLKPDAEHASVGVSADGYAADLAAAAAGLAQPGRAGPDGWFAERYVEGREFNVSLLAGPEGVEALPVAEMVFDFPTDRLRILDYRAKWDTGSFEYNHTHRLFGAAPAELPLREEMARLARRCWDLFGLRGYARVDFRVDAAGRPWILEVNANPCLSKDAGFAAAAAVAGIGYPDAIGRIVAAAVGAERAPEDAESNAATPSGPVQRTVAAAHGCRFRYEVVPEDADRVRNLVSRTGYFLPAEAEVAVELVAERLAKGAASGYEFVLAEADGRLAGYACFGPTPCTLASFDLYWIAVDPDCQGGGLGRALMAESEALIRRMGGSRVYVETAGRAKYEATRRFYERCNYRVESRLDDFYGPGDAKYTFLKIL
jgi:D-alanine-D-alanine ligase-like ATP-grasp enzyme/ribosomal protein S18 acetylase RimI-like enzyme